MKTKLLTTLIAATLALSAPLALAAVPKDMLVIGKAADPQTLDPAVTIDNNDWTVTYPSYQRLVKYKLAPRRWKAICRRAGRRLTTRKSGRSPRQIMQNSLTVRR